MSSTSCNARKSKTQHLLESGAFLALTRRFSPGNSSSCKQAVLLLSQGFSTQVENMLICKVDLMMGRALTAFCNLHMATWSHLLDGYSTVSRLKEDVPRVHASFPHCEPSWDCISQGHVQACTKAEKSEVASLLLLL